jgi:hypothetical protein
MNSGHEQVVTELPPHCVRIDIDIDDKKLVASFFELFSKLNYTYDEFVKKGLADSANLTAIENVAWSMNLNYLPELVGEDRWSKYRGVTESIITQGISPVDFTASLEELNSTYLKEVIESVTDYYHLKFNKIFRGTVELVWVASGQQYQFHIDHELCGVRYHVPIITNDQANWLFKDRDAVIKMHMPVGTAWEFWPRSIEHTVLNGGTEPRVHLIITEMFNV